MEERRPEVDPSDKEQQHVCPTEELRSIRIYPEHPERVVRIGSHLEKEPASAQVGFLRKNRDVFTWRPSDLTGVSPKVAIHMLNVRPDAQPVKQKRRHFGVAKD